MSDNEETIGKAKRREPSIDPRKSLPLAQDRINDRLMLSVVDAAHDALKWATIVRRLDDTAASLDRMAAAMADLDSRLDAFQQTCVVECMNPMPLYRDAGTFGLAVGEARYEIDTMAASSCGQWTTILRLGKHVCTMRDELVKLGIIRPATSKERRIATYIKKHPFESAEAIKKTLALHETPESLRRTMGRVKRLFGITSHGKRGYFPVLM